VREERTSEDNMTSSQLLHDVNVSTAHNSYLLKLCNGLVQIRVFALS